MIARTKDRLRTKAEGSGSSERRGMRDRLMAPVDPAGLAVFRIGFGVVIAWEVWREYEGGAMRFDYILPDFNYRWWLFEWVRPLPDTLMYAAFAVLALAAALFAAGLFYRVAAGVVFIGLTYWFLMEKARYLNHHYLACLLAFLFVIVPAHSAFSVDAIRKPWVRSRTVPAWAVWLIRFQVGVPYFFAGIAKLNFDWIVRNEPLRMWLAESTDFPLVGQLFAQAGFVRLLAWGSAALDLTAPFLLLHRRTRVAAYALTLVFHFVNSRLFGIGIFPWMMIVATTVFFDPGWPRELARSLRSGSPLVRGVVRFSFVGGFVIGGFLPGSFAAVRALSGGFGAAFLAYQVLPERLRRPEAAPAEAPAPSPWRRFGFGKVLAVFLSVWVAVQILVPVRHWVIPGNVNWTEEGGRFAWRMLLVHSRVTLTYEITDPATGARWIEDPSQHVSAFQLTKTKTPDMMLQLAHRMEEYYRTAGYDDLEVRLTAVSRVNGRDPALLIDPLVDLTRIRRPYIPPADWIRPFRPYR